MLLNKLTRLRQRMPFTLPVAALLALLLGWTATAVLFVAIRHIEHRAFVNDFQQRAGLRIGAVQRGISGALGELQALNLLFVTSEDVDRKQFRDFTAPLLARSPYMQAFNYHRLVPHARRAEYEAAMRAQFPGFAITELVPGSTDLLRAAGELQLGRGIGATRLEPPRHLARIVKLVGERLGPVRSVNLVGVLAVRLVDEHEALCKGRRE